MLLRFLSGRRHPDRFVTRCGGVEKPHATRALAIRALTWRAIANPGAWAVAVVIHHDGRETEVARHRLDGVDAPH